jgi:FHA domain
MNQICRYYWTSFECEVCQTSFPFKFKTKNGRKYTLFEYPVQKTQNFIVLESINIEKSTSKTIFILTPANANKEYRIGRGPEQDIRLNDISVSRQHARIYFDGISFTLRDDLSKFGTLVQIQDTLLIRPH